MHLNELPLPIAILTTHGVKMVGVGGFMSAPLDTVDPLVFKVIDNSNHPSGQSNMALGWIFRMDNLWPLVGAPATLSRTSRHSTAASWALAIIFVMSDKLRKRLVDLVFRHGKSHESTSNGISDYPAAQFYYTLQARLV